MAQFVEVYVPGLMVAFGLYFISAAVNGRFFFHIRKPDPNGAMTKQDRERAGGIGATVLVLAFLYAWSGVFA